MFEDMHLSNPPLKVCLATISFTTIQNMESYIPSIQDGFRKDGFPFFSARRPLILGTTGPMVPVETQQWIFHDEKHENLIVVTDQSFSFSTYAYDGYDRFIEKLVDYLKIFGDIVSLEKCVIERIGLRYINGFDEDGWEKSLKSGFSGFTFENEPFYATGGRNAQLTMTQIDTKLDGAATGKMVLQVYRDSAPINIPSGILFIDGKHPDLSKTKAVLDIDHFVFPKSMFHYDAARKVLGLLHEVCNTVFFRIVSAEGKRK